MAPSAINVTTAVWPVFKNVDFFPDSRGIITKCGLKMDKIG